MPTVLITLMILMTLNACDMYKSDKQVVNHNKQAIYVRCIDGWEYLMVNRGIAPRFNRNGSPRRCAANGLKATK